jgi:hypothetical protein
MRFDEVGDDRLPHAPGAQDQLEALADRATAASGLCDQVRDRPHVGHRGDHATLPPWSRT